MKILKRIVAVIVVLLVAVKLSPYEYLIKGVKNAYLKGYTSAHLETVFLRNDDVGLIFNLSWARLKS